MPKSLVPNQFDYSGVYVEGLRNQFRFYKPVLASGMSGMLIPMGDPIPVFPGVKLDLKANMVVRSNTMTVPPLDGIYLDVFAIWVPHRIVWTSFPQFLGENDTTAWTQSVSLVYPSLDFQSIINLNTGRINSTSYQGDVVIANHFLSPHYGLASKTTISSTDAAYNLKINALAYRGYYACWNYFFRDENYQKPVLFSKGNNGSSGDFGYLVRDYDVNSTSTLSTMLSTSIGTGLFYGNAVLMPVCKFHDAFTSVLPQAQFGNGVELPLGTWAPIQVYGMSAATYASQPVSNDFDYTNLGDDKTGMNVTENSGQDIYNLGVDLSLATAATINQLRTSIMYQRYLEALARGGRRTPEYYEVIYHVKNTQAQADYPQMLSHARYMLGVNQVVATADSSGSGWSSHLGDTGAYSLTNLKGIPICEREFSEFGYLHILYCVRADNRYSQAIPEHFTRSTLLDEYNPYFDHIGDVEVPNYLVNMNASSKSNFGFQEAWWQERTEIGISVGALNKSYGSLAYWVLGEVLPSSLVTCTPGYLCFDPAVFNDVFVSAYYTYPQFIFDCLIYGKKAGRMSLHSIPGIVGRI